jgi:hypothetical protein
VIVIRQRSWKSQEIRIFESRKACPRKAVGMARLQDFGEFLAAARLMIELTLQEQQAVDA